MIVDEHAYMATDKKIFRYCDIHLKLECEGVGVKHLNLSMVLAPSEYTFFFSGCNIFDYFIGIKVHL